VTGNTKPVVEVAKQMKGIGAEKIVTLSDGNRAKILPVSAALIDAVTSRIKDPEVPMWHNPERDADEPNPSDPKYLKGLENANRQRGIAAIDAIVMFGVELVDGVPEDGTWLKKLKYMAKHGQLDLSEYNLEDAEDIEFLYKRYIIADNDLITMVSEASGLTPEDEAAASKSFPGNKER
jgi:hypothetical protein